MTLETFAQILNRRINQMRTTLESKGARYASRGDRLANAKTAASITGTSPPSALFGMMAKHFVVLFDWMSRDYCPQQSEIDETVGDIINYLVLIESAFVEEDNSEKIPPAESGT